MLFLLINICASDPVHLTFSSMLPFRAILDKVTCPREFITCKNVLSEIRSVAAE